MVNPVSYVQGCPVCGRRLRISVHLLGQRVYCQHCGGGFVAQHDDRSPLPAGQPPARQVDRAEELLARAARLLEQTGVHPR